MAQVLVQSLSSRKDGSDSRVLATAGKLQLLQHVEISSVEKGNVDPAEKGSPTYMRIISRVPDRGEKDKKGRRNEKRGE